MVRPIDSPPAPPAPAGIDDPDLDDDDDLDSEPLEVQAPRHRATAHADRPRKTEPTRRDGKLLSFNGKTFEERRQDIETSHQEALNVSKWTGAIGGGLAVVGGAFLLMAGPLGWITVGGAVAAGWLLMATAGAFGLISLLNFLSELVTHPTALENLAREERDALEREKAAGKTPPPATERPRPTDPRAALAPSTEPRPGRQAPGRPHGSS